MRFIVFFLISLFPLLPYAQTKVDFEKGKKLIAFSKYDSAKVYFQTTLEHCKNCDDTTVAYLHTYLGKTFQSIRKYDLALDHINKGIKLFERAKNDNGKAFSLISLAELYRKLNQYKKAETHLKNALYIHERTDISPSNLAYLYNRYAPIAGHLKNKEKEIEYSLKSIKIANQIGNKEIEASSLNHMGFIMERNNSLEALDYYFKALTI